MSTTEYADYKQEIPVEVTAGKTVVLNVKAKPIGPGKPADPEEEPTIATGSIDVEFVDNNQKSIELSGPLFLIDNENTSLSIPIIQEGTRYIARGDNIPVGTYTLSLEESSVDPTEPIKLEQIIYFESGKSKITRATSELLDAVSKTLIDKVGTSGIFTLEIRGYTDSIGSSVANKQLAMERAKAAKDVLTGKLKDTEAKLEGGRIFTVINGIGELENDAAENRRVEFYWSLNEIKISARSSSNISSPDAEGYLNANVETGWFSTNKKVSDFLNDIIIRKTTDKKRIYLQDRSWIRSDGNGGIELGANNVTSISLKSNEAFISLCSGAAGLNGNITDGDLQDQALKNKVLKAILDYVTEADSLEAMLSKIIADYYTLIKKVNGFGGNPFAKNNRGSGQFNYLVIKQVIAEYPKPYPPGLECFGSSIVHLIKSLGLINPLLSRKEFEIYYTSIHGDPTSPEKIFFDPKEDGGNHHDLRGLSHGAIKNFLVNTKNGREKLLAEIRKFKKTDWAKLLGMNTVVFERTAFSPKEASRIKSELNKGWVLHVFGPEGTFYDTGHYVTVTNFSVNSYDIWLDESLKGKNVKHFRKYWTEQEWDNYSTVLRPIWYIYIGANG